MVNPYLQMMSDYSRTCRSAVIQLLSQLATAWGMDGTITTSKTPDLIEYSWEIQDDELGVVITLDCENPQRYNSPEVWRLMVGKPARYSAPGLGNHSYFRTFPVSNEGLMGIADYINEWGSAHFSK